MATLFPVARASCPCTVTAKMAVPHQSESLPGLGARGLFFSLAALACFASWRETGKGDLRASLCGGHERPKLV